MFGVRLSKVFKSRWHALLWASLVLLTAYCSVPAAHEQGDAEQIAAIVDGTQKHEDRHEHRHEDRPVHHTNPWAKDAD